MEYTEIKCPICGNKIMLKTYINSFLEPEEKERIYNRTIFEYVCSECDEEMYIDHSIIYHDVKNKAIVCYKFDGIKELEKIKENNQLFQYSIVDNMNEFIERIMIYEVGLDVYTVHLLKQDFYEKIKRKRKISSKNIFFFTEAGKMFFHCIYDDDDDEVFRIGGMYNAKSYN